VIKENELFTSTKQHMEILYSQLQYQTNKNTVLVIRLVLSRWGK